MYKTVYNSDLCVGDMILRPEDGYVLILEKKLKLYIYMSYSRITMPIHNSFLESNMVFVAKGFIVKSKDNRKICDFKLPNSKYETPKI